MKKPRKHIAYRSEIRRGRGSDSPAVIRGRRRAVFKEYRKGEGKTRRKDDEARRVYTKGQEHREGWRKRVKEKDIRVRKNESIRTDAEEPSTADKRDS